jgi:hypothetical protein
MIPILGKAHQMKHKGEVCTLMQCNYSMRGFGRDATVQLAKLKEGENEQALTI